MPKALRVLLIVLAPFFWFALLCSLSIRMLAWRVDNEPGAAAVPELHAAFWIFLLTGLAGTAAVHFFLIKYRAGRIWLVWIVNGGATLLYLPFFLLTLLLMA
jgi:hypothetical protein